MKQIVKKINWLQLAQMVLVLTLALTPLFAGAQFSSGENSKLCTGTGLNCNAGQDVNSLIKTVINWLLGIAFGVAVLFLIIGGFWYITSAGNEETAEKGKNTAINAIIGIVMIILSYVIVNVVANLVSKAGSGTGNP